jgi:hypothetical protein
MAPDRGLVAGDLLGLLSWVVLPDSPATAGFRRPLNRHLPFRSSRKSVIRSPVALRLIVLPPRLGPLT